jgi:uncharacterized protein YkwD
MHRSVRAPGRRRLASLFLAVVALGAVSAPAVTHASYAVDEATLDAQEAAMVKLLNADRTAVGLVPVQVDSRLMAIARARSNDMVAKGYFSHTQPDGRNVFDILTAAHITWYTAGEIIAWNNYPIDSTTSAANRQWMGSPGHHAIIVSTSYNYVGVGLAVDPATGEKIWTAVYLQGPDRTGARAGVGKPSVAAGPTTATRRVKVPWSGADVRLQVLTAGLHHFTVQRKADDGAWATTWSSTTALSGTFTLYLGHRYEIRVAAVDRRGNRGSWVTTVVDLR